MCSWTRYFWQAVDDNRGIQDDTKGANKTRGVTWGWGGSHMGGMAKNIRLLGQQVTIIDKNHRYGMPR